MSVGMLTSTARKVTKLFQFNRDFLFITLDSLRFDTAAQALQAGTTPTFQKLVGQWERRHTSATYTLPAHVSMFSGSMPRPPRGDDRSVESEPRMFALSTSWSRYKGRNIRYFFDDAENVPKGFESKGYQTIGLGGVGWFSNEVKASSFWEGRYFQKFLYKPSYGEQNPRAFEEQITDLAALLRGLEPGRRFVFVNVSSTHRPYSNGDGTMSVKSQRMCLEYVDQHLPKLLELFPRGAVGVVCGDHGDCMGEDGLWGHNVVHEQVMTVPYAEFEF
ncbi:MAG TPA: sulfatase-like hydrolase/transferase [Pirellulales bacterium]|nr:sulfatase-like hydrolase/transferase [Pirellulales bacterium]